MYLSFSSARNIDRKLLIANLELFALSPGRPPYKIAVYVPGSKVRMGDWGNRGGGKGGIYVRRRLPGNVHIYSRMVHN